MISSFVKYLLFTASFAHAVTRECVVSDWTAWSTCIGDCDYGLLVRNRDVVAPPFPLRHSNGTVTTPLCPHLFETRSCIPDSCHSTQATLPTQPFPTPGPLMDEEKAKKLEEDRLDHSNKVDTTKLTLPMGENSDNENNQKLAGEARRPLRLEGVTQRRTVARNGKHHRNTVRSTTESVPVEITTLIDLPSETIRQHVTPAKGSTGTPSLSIGSTPEASASTTGQSVRKERILENTSIQDERPTTKTESSSTAETANTVIPVGPQDSVQNPEYFINSLTIDIPMKKKITPEVERRLKTKLNINKIKYRNFGELDSPPTTTESTMNDVLRQLESAADLNIPLDDKHIRKALRKNRTLMKALLDAYKYRRSNNKSSEVMKNLVSTESTELSSQSSSSEVFTSTTESPSAATNSGVWSRANYVPNTRQHASDITSKLYMTHEIVQALSDEPIRRSPILRVECLENPRCCKIERTLCPDGQKPKLVKRYYRPPGAAVCSPYHYPKCGQLEEMDEKPIQFEQNCQDLCFATSEKRIEPFTRMANDSS